MSIPIDDLLLQVQKKEVEIIDINLTELARKFQEGGLALYPGARFIAGLAHLIYLKAKFLVPDEQLEGEVADEETPVGLTEEQLEEYRAFKEVARTFSIKEREQGMHFLRSASHIPEKTIVRELHLPVDIEEFSKLFVQIWQQASSRAHSIYEEEWTVAIGIKIVRHKLLAKRLSITDLFPADYSKEQLIVTFLAILELLKNQEAYLLKEQEGWQLISTTA